MQSMRVPISLCQDVEKMQRAFILEHKIGEKKVHHVALSTICQPKRKGGLGLRLMHRMNFALLMKMGWRICTKPNKLCAKVIKGKYGRGVISKESAFLGKVTLLFGER